MTKRTTRLLGAVVLVGVLCASCGTARPPARAVSYRAEDLNTGRTVSVQDLRGRPVLLASWATWCAPCRVELPAIEKLYQARRRDGLKVVAVNLDSSDRNKAAITDVVHRLGLTMPQWRDGNDTFTTTFRGFAIPMSVLLDRDGHVVKTWHGPLDTDAPEVEQELRKVLAKSQSG